MLGQVSLESIYPVEYYFNQILNTLYIQTQSNHQVHYRVEVLKTTQQVSPSTKPMQPVHLIQIQIQTQTPNCVFSRRSLVQQSLQLRTR